MNHHLDNTYLFTFVPTPTTNHVTPSSLAASAAITVLAVLSDMPSVTRMPMRFRGDDPGLARFCENISLLIVVMASKVFVPPRCCCIPSSAFTISDAVVYLNGNTDCVLCHQSLM